MKQYQHEVLPTTIAARVVVEAAATGGWYRFVGMHGAVIGLDRFGASAPAKDVYRDCGITVERVVAMTKEVIYSVASAAHHAQSKCVSG